MTEMVERDERLESARDAISRHSWTEAIEAFTAAGEDALSPDDLELLGTAQWWDGRPDESNDALERAFRGYDGAGRRVDAARVAMALGYQAMRGLAGPVGAGWLGQAGRLLAEEPEGPEHVRLAVFQAVGALMANNIEEGLELADRAMAMARRHGVEDGLYMAMSFQGVARLFAGQWREGLAAIDEAAAAASAGRLDLRVASDIYCNTIAACRNIGDLDRAAQWAEAGERWMLRNGAGGYPGICRVHKAELKMLHGDWPAAEQEARQACDELRRFKLLDSIGWAQYQIGEVRLRMGDLDGAAEAFDTAYEYGHDAQPGLAVLQLARGEVDDAKRSLGRALAATESGRGTMDRAARGRLLPVQVDISLASGDLEAARLAVEELESIAADYERPLFQAGAMTARGALLLGEERPSEAEPVLGKSWRLWQSSDLPYESARARLRYAQALLAEGDTAMARRDLQAARGAFERLGATRDLKVVDELLATSPAGEAGAAPAGAGPASRPEARVTRTFMFTDIVTSTDLVGLIGDEAWSELLGWHDRELRSAIAQHRGEEVDHTGDGFFVAFERASDAIEAAVEIQRRLVRHRREHGFAPWVRIGLHTAEATRRGRNYTGQGVHVAARVGAAAGREEIVVSRDTVAAAGPTRFQLSAPREVTLKGVKAPLEVRSVEWR
jgi:class 3 adenylate cyclase